MSAASAAPATDPPAIILVGPQLGENIGTAARAMLNCGLTDLRLVAPRDGWPNPQAWAPAVGAHGVLEQARVFPTLTTAVADLRRVYATSARHRDMVKPVLTPRQAAAEIHAKSVQGERSGILFGPERTGLSNDEVVLAHRLVEVPLNPDFSSLNLAQAVLILAYEWWQARPASESPAQPSGVLLATHAELTGFYAHLERALDATGFFKTPELRPSMVRNLRNLFLRADLTEQEVRTLHGVLTALCGRSMDGL